MFKEKDTNWYKGSLIKVFLQNKKIVFNKDTIDNYIVHFRNQILQIKNKYNR